MRQSRSAHTRYLHTRTSHSEYGQTGFLLQKGNCLPAYPSLANCFAPLTAEACWPRNSKGVWSVDGSPTDSVLLGFLHVVEDEKT
jgi:hypothetical protein